MILLEPLIVISRPGTMFTKVQEVHDSIQRKILDFTVTLLKDTFPGAGQMNQGFKNNQGIISISDYNSEGSMNDVN